MISKLREKGPIYVKVVRGDSEEKVGLHVNLKKRGVGRGEGGDRYY